MAEERAQVAEALYESNLSRESMQVEQLRELLLAILSSRSEDGHAIGRSGADGLQGRSGGPQDTWAKESQEGKPTHVAHTLNKNSLLLQLQLHHKLPIQLGS